MSNQIKITRGDTKTITVPVTLKTVTVVEGKEITTEVPLDLTDYTATLTAKRNANQPDSAAVMVLTGDTGDDPTAGVIIFEFTEDDTNITPGNYFYDVQIVNEADSKVYTVVEPTPLIITPDITRTGLSS